MVFERRGPKGVHPIDRSGLVRRILRCQAKARSLPDSPAPPSLLKRFRGQGNEGDEREMLPSLKNHEKAVEKCGDYLRYFQTCV